MQSDKIARNKGKPYENSCAHTDKDIARFVEVLWVFSRLESVEGTGKDQQEVVGERRNEALW